MELRHLRYFVAVAEELHFGRAAERLRIVQPALSKQVASLEAELGVQLLHRTKRRVALTEAGSVFFEQALKILEQTELAVETARRAARGQIGRLAIGFIGPATYSVLPRIIRVYRERFPDVELALHEWTTMEQVRRLNNGFIQVGFVRLPINDDGLVLEPVLEEPVMVVLPEGHPLVALDEVPIQDLANEPFILIPRHREPGLHDLCISVCRGAGFSPRVVQEANRLHTIVGLVASGMGVAFAPASIEQLRRPGVVYRNLHGAFPKLVMAVASRRGDAPPVLQAFLDTVNEITSPRPVSEPSS